MLVAVSLYLWGTKIDPQRLTELLGVPPSTARAKGEARTLSTQQVVTARIGVWEFSTDPELSSVVLADHLDLLRSRFGPTWAMIADLPDVEEACVDVFVAINAKADGTEGSFEMSPKNLSDLQQLGLPVRFTVAFTDVARTIDEEP